MIRLNTILLLLLSSLLGGCSISEFIVGNRKTPYQYDNDKSYALNMLKATTSKQVGLYDTTDGGWFYLNNKLKTTIEPKSNLPATVGNAAGNATIVAYNAATANSLASAGVSSGVEAGAAGGLVMVGALLNTDNMSIWMMGKSPTIFGWIPQNGSTRVEGRKKLSEIFLTAVKKTAAEINLDAPYEFAEPITFLRDEEPTDGSLKIDSYVYLPIKRGTCGESDCGFVFPLHKYTIFSRPAPVTLGGEISWQYTYTNFLEEMLPTVNIAGLTEFNFYKALSKNLPDSFFIVLPMQNRKGKVLVEETKWKDIFLQRPIMLNRGEIFRFVTPQ